jgi:hypothetical protein
MSTSASTRAAVLRALNFGNRFALVYSDPPQPERRCWTVGHGGDGCPGTWADCTPAPAEPARVPAPEGVTVIGWTEPTDDEPRSLPMIAEVEGGFTEAPAGWRFAEQRDVAYIIEPIPSPPVPETERVPTLAEAIEGLIKDYRQSGIIGPTHSSMLRGVERLIDAVNHEHDLTPDERTVEFLVPLDGTDGD